MIETGLMFKAPLVLAILEGRKTQTRRILKPQPAPNHPHDGGTKWVLERGLHVPVGSVGHLSVREKMGLHCPMGKPGDRIYVREAHRFPASLDKSSAAKIAEQCLDAGYNSPWCPTLYEADGKRRENWNDFATPPLVTAPGKLRPSLLMPKYAARIWLEITGVRVEHLQDISNEDAIAEGVNRISHGREGDYYSAIRDEQHPKNWNYPDDAFRELWDSTTGRPALPANTNSKRYARVKHWLDTHPDTTGWAANPWVWVIDFKTISTTGRPA